MILMSVDLPAPFSPTSARFQLERYTAQRMDSRERFADVFKFEKEGHGWPVLFANGDQTEA
jgi:hypothetical protein